MWTDWVGLSADLVIAVKCGQIGFWLSDDNCEVWRNFNDFRLAGR